MRKIASFEKWTVDKLLLASLLSSVVAIVGVILCYINNIVAALIFIALSLVIFAIGRKRFGTIVNCYSLFGLSWFGVIGLACLRLHQNQVPWKIETWIICIIAFLAFSIGFTLRRVGDKKEKGTKLDKRKSIISIGILFAASFMAFLVEAFIRGGVPLFSKEMSSYVDFSVTGVHYLTVCSCLILPLSVIHIFAFRKEMKVKEYVILAIMNIVAIMVPVMIVSRQLILMTVVLGGAIALILRPKWSNYIISAGVIFGLIGWVGISMFRNQDSNYLRQALEIQDDSVLDVTSMQIYMYAACNFDNLDLNVGEIESFSYGTKSLFPLFVFTGLKFVFPELLDGAALQRITPTYNTYPMVMSPYQDFGAIGVLVYMIIVGIMCRIVQEMDNKRVLHLMLKVIVAYCLFFSFFTDGFAIPTNWFYVIVLFVWDRFVLQRGMIETTKMSAEGR